MASKKKTEKEDRNSRKPWVSNYPPLHAWLQKHEARCDFQLPLGSDDNPQAYIEQYRVPGSALAIIVVVYNNRMGWDIFTPGGQPKIDNTLKDAEQRLGLLKPDADIEQR